MGVAPLVSVGLRFKSQLYKSATWSQDQVLISLHLCYPIYNLGVIIAYPKVLLQESNKINRKHLAKYLEY